MPQERTPGRHSLVQNFEEPTKPKQRRSNFDLGCVKISLRLGPPPRDSRTNKRKGIKLTGVGPEEEAEVEVRVKAEVSPAVRPCQSSSSSEVRLKEEGRDMVGNLCW